MFIKTEKRINGIILSFGFVLAFLIVSATLIIQYAIIPNTVERRFKELALTKYDSKTGEVVLKDSVVTISEWDFRYIKYGTMKTDKD
jgi:hypothetical protein